ncbi:hypothetical protein M501DRAFT_1056379 [Patellaria atrata CBS 101060]|uniref:Uncharacterized protein n=1 Tax=Patellaria atrata CBS 101060 TaxID=1346257 RepID=A0A9P4SE86_9PEZI|nr:hypothetical protein M501DRAFT_1056379 [Patellaria atrata CBS 101060]
MRFGSTTPIFLTSTVAVSAFYPIPTPLITIPSPIASILSSRSSSDSSTTNTSTPVLKTGITASFNVNPDGSLGIRADINISDADISALIKLIVAHLDDIYLQSLDLAGLLSALGTDMLGATAQNSRSIGLYLPVAEVRSPDVFHDEREDTEETRMNLPGTEGQSSGIKTSDLTLLDLPKVPMTFPFLKLPIELRIEIYKLLLQQQARIDVVQV